MSDTDSVLYFNSIAGPTGDAQIWGEVVMSLTRRLAEVPSSGTSPFVLGVTFYAPSRYVDPDWSGVRIGRLSRKYGVLEAKATLPETLTPDPIATVLDLAAEAVAAANRYARDRRLSLGLAEIESALQRLIELGPAPVRARSPLSSAVVENVRTNVVLRASGSSGEEYQDPSEGLLESMLDDVLEGTEDAVVIERLAPGAAPVKLTLVRALTGTIQFTESRQGRPPMVGVVSDEDLMYAVLADWAFGHDERSPDVNWREVNG